MKSIKVTAALLVLLLGILSVLAILGSIESSVALDYSLKGGAIIIILGAVGAIVMISMGRPAGPGSSDTSEPGPKF